MSADAPNIIRTRKNRENPYTMIARAPLNDAALSWEARGVLAYLLDKPDDWEVRFQDLVHKGPGKEDRMRRILHELEAAGYVHRARTSGTRGRFLWETLVYETPELARAQASTPQETRPIERPPSRENRHMVPPAPSAGLPSMVLPSMVLPSMENRHIYQDGPEPKTEVPNTEGESAAPSLSTIEHFDVTTQTPWAYQAAHTAGISPSRVQLLEETAAWQDQIRRGARDVPQDVAADWRQWMRRHFHWLKTHPEEGPDGNRRGDPAPDGAAARAAREQREQREQRAAADLQRTLSALPGPGAPPG